jgi:formylglycine-generating enzyme required for sulfatase activity
MEHKEYLENRLARINEFIDTQRKELSQDKDESQVDKFLEPFIVEKEYLEANLYGSGAIAQGDHAVAVGEGGSFIQQNIIFYGARQYDPEKAIKLYKNVVLNSLSKISFGWFDRRIRHDQGLNNGIDLFYIPLTTTALLKPDDSNLPSVEAGQTYVKLSAVDAIIKNKYVVILGDPGSGKSTLLKYMMLNLSRSVDRSLGVDEYRSSGAERLNNALPLYIPLKDFAQKIVKENQANASPEHLWNYIKQSLKAVNVQVAEGPIHELLENGKCIILCDGLDEILTSNSRLMVRNAILTFLNRYQNNRCVVTCRTLAYLSTNEVMEADVRFPGWAKYELSPFNLDQIHSFMEIWSHSFSDVEIRSARERVNFINDMKRALRDDKLEGIASNPLNLNLILLIESDLKKTINGIANLYEEVITFLILGWERSKATSMVEVPYIQHLLNKAGKSIDDLKKNLYELAFEAQKDAVKMKDAPSLGDIPEYRIVKLFSKMHQGNLNWGAQLCDVIRLRTGLLQEKQPEIYTFPHLRFQSYLAGAHLSLQNNFVKIMLDLAGEGEKWQDVILFAISRIVFVESDIDKPLLLVNELCPTDICSQDESLKIYNVCLAGEILVEIALSNYQNRRRLGHDLFHRLQTNLVYIFGDNSLPPIQRAKAGNILAKLGDPRFMQDFYFLPNEPLIGLVEIPQGSFIMGSDPILDASSYERETPQHEICLPKYYISKYLVTNGQFKEFLEDSAYSPKYPGAQSGFSNHPVINLTWHDAMEFCRWLNQKLLDSEKTPHLIKKLLLTDGYAVSLPSEAEWEKAARGSDGRIFPWGNALLQNVGNFHGINIETTTPVGCFSKGMSPYGVLDMSGNIWEWTRSLWGRKWEYPDFGYPYISTDGREEIAASDEILRIIRGSGAYQYTEKYLRCAYKSRFSPRDTELNYTGFGFRIAITHQQNP